MSIQEQTKRINVEVGWIAILRIKMAALTTGKEMGQVVTELVMANLPAVPNEESVTTNGEASEDAA